LAGRIRDEDIEAVRQRTDLAKVVGQYLTLKKAGHDSLVGLCPFHSEKTASFSVSPSKQVYHCFGCGAGGDAVKFLQAVENLTFPEAVERLAKEANVRLRYEGESPADRRAGARRQALYKANESVADLYHRTLMDSPEAEEARKYLEERGIMKEAAERFQIGFAPRASDFVLRRTAGKVSADLLVEAGLVSRDSGGTLRDRFRGRITFPIRDLSGRSIGFGARVLPSSDPKQAKYINTAETPVYRKGELLYNLDRAKTAVTRSSEAVVVEGYTDVITLAEAGVENAVATCGTALSEGHLRLLSRFAERAVLTFDADEAGARAAERAFAFHEDVPVEAVVLILPEGLDPADFVRKNGGEAFLESAKAARPLVEYMVRRAIERADVSTIEGQSRAVEAAMPMVAGLKDPVRRQQYAHLLADLVGVPESSVLAKLQRTDAAADAGTTADGRTRQPAADARVSVQEKVEHEMLKLLARDADTYRALTAKLTDEHFQSGGNRGLFRTLVEANGDVTVLVAGSQDERLVKEVSELVLEPLDGDSTPEYANGVWARLQEFALQRKSAEMRRRLQKLNPTTDAGYDALFQELISLDGELRRLRASAQASG